jgi:hypothetical protein
MQNCVQDLFDIIIFSYMCYDTVSSYDSTIVSLIINYADTSTFYMYEMHDTPCRIIGQLCTSRQILT